MIDVDHQISAVERTVGDRVLEAGTARVLTASRTYDATLEELWDACTSAERIPRWFLPVSGDLRVGGRYQLEGNAGGTIERCDPPRSFAATWEYGDEVTWIEVAPRSRGRRPDPPHARARRPRRRRALAAVRPGRRGRRLGPRARWASGSIWPPARPNDPAEFAAWTGSPDGVGFVTRSSRGWADASIAAGTDAAEAHAAEERTTAFYTGTGG